MYFMASSFEGMVAYRRTENAEIDTSAEVQPKVPLDIHRLSVVKITWTEKAT